MHQEPPAQGRRSDHERRRGGDRRPTSWCRCNETLPVLRADPARRAEAHAGAAAARSPRACRRGVDRNSAAAEQLLHHLDQIALDIKRHDRRAGRTTTSRSRSRTFARSPRASSALVGTGDSRDGQDRRQAPPGPRQDRHRHRQPEPHASRTWRRCRDKVKNGEGTVGRLLNDDTIANNVEQITEDAGGFIRSMTRLQTLVGSALGVQRRRQHAQDLRAVQLQSRPDKFFLIELVDDPRGFAHRHRDLHDHRRSVQAADDQHRRRSTITRSRSASPSSSPSACSSSTGGMVADRPLRHQGVDRRHRRRHRDPAGAGVAAGCARSTFNSTCSTSAPTPIRASRSWRRSSSTSTSGSSAASTTSSTAAGPAPACHGPRLLLRHPAHLQRRRHPRAAHHRRRGAARSAGR